MCNITATYVVAGMTGNGCAGRVTNAVTNVQGVVDADVDVTNGTLRVSGHIDEAAIRAAVAEAGYSVASS
jgi:copper chaperone